MLPRWRSKIGSKWRGRPPTAGASTWSGEVTGPTSMIGRCRGAALIAAVGRGSALDGDIHAIVGLRSLSGAMRYGSSSNNERW
jgi:hypothetical protein